MSDTDLSGLSPKDAAEYVLAFITTLKTTERDLAKAREEADLWRRRSALAVERGQPELAAQAQARQTECEAKATQLEAEVLDLKGKVSVLKDNLTRVRMQVPRTVDVDMLLTQLQMIVGEKDMLADKFKSEEASAKLEELKKKMGGGNSTPDGGGAAPGA